MTANFLARQVKKIMKSPVVFSQKASGIRLRKYQTDPALAIVDSVLHDKGLTFCVCFPRQSGKNELQAQIELYLLAILSGKDAEIVKVSPTWKPQSLNAMRRIERVGSRNILTRTMIRKESGYIYVFGSARISFFTGSPESNIVGATASTLLEVDEAQDIQPAKYDKDIAPMAASTNATRVFWGTAWTSQTLLAREMRACQALEQQDGIRRVFRLTAAEVTKEVPAYGRFVEEQVSKLGRTHPMVRTQYFSEEIDAEGGLFTAARQNMMRGVHPAGKTPKQGSFYAFLVDVGGAEMENTGVKSNVIGGSGAEHDSTVLTIVEVDITSCADPILRAPTYLVRNRYQWTGLEQSKTYGQIKAMAELWRPRWVVIDATGLGAGLAGFLDTLLPGRVTQFVFNQSSKSKLGWDFLAVIDTGRFRDYSVDDAGSPEFRLQELFFRQLAGVQYEILPGANKTLKWSVPNGTRDRSNGQLLHDDLVMSAALCAAIDEMGVGASGEALVIKAMDPLAAMSKGF